MAAINAKSQICALAASALLLFLPQAVLAQTQERDTSAILDIEERLRQPEATACREAADCAIVRGACDEWTTVNQSFSEDADRYYRYMATVVECTGDMTQSTPPEVTCETGRCTLPAVLIPDEENAPAGTPGFAPGDPGEDNEGSYE